MHGVENSTLCYCAWAASGASITLSLLVALVLCCTCNAGRCVGPWVHLVCGSIGTAGWAVFGGIYSDQVGTTANATYMLLLPAACLAACLAACCLILDALRSLWHVHSAVAADRESQRRGHAA